MSLRTDELKNRIESKQKALQSRLAELKADTQGKAADELVRVKAKLKELEVAVKDGWDRVSDATVQKLNEWLDRN